MLWHGAPNYGSLPVSELLRRILAQEAPAYALIYRPVSGNPGMLDVLIGEVTELGSLDELSRNDHCSVGAAQELLAVIPYRQLAERGFVAPDDGTPLVAMRVSGHEEVPVADVLRRLPEAPTILADGHFDLDDDTYADVVRQVVANEIGAGEGANFVIKRSFQATIVDHSQVRVMSFFRRLLQGEQGAYWTFLISIGRNVLVGASPERHISLDGRGQAVMNPISGTYRYPPSGPTVDDILKFLADNKETDELYMVLDEELKMMARICAAGGRVWGPYLKEMAWLAHTEYLITGKVSSDVRAILRETMFAPTVTGSPLESAARVIGRYEPEGRRYYGGVAALIGRGPDGTQTLDSAILIRTAEIDPSGRLRVAVGATLVRHSDPAAEALETKAKLSGLLAALDPGGLASLGLYPSVRAARYRGDKRFENHPDIRASLRHRNDGIARFWLLNPDERDSRVPELEGATALVVDAEDTFTAMLEKQLRSLGLLVTVRRFDEPHSQDAYDLLVMGPGPGNPGSSDFKMTYLRSAIASALRLGTPMLAVCLSHQVLSIQLGLELRRLKTPNQGCRREIDLFGRLEGVGFYNTFAAYSDATRWDVEGIGMVEASRHEVTGEVYAVRGPGFASVQFHAESVLTIDGPRIMAGIIRGLLHR